MNALPDIADQPPRVLIVDDEPQNRQLLAAMLAPEGFLLESAAGGEEALAMVALHPPDLILLDVMMPRMNGHTVARRIKADAATKNIPIIMVTALDDRDARLLGLSAGAEDFLSKPVDRAELCVRVRNLLRLKAYGDYHNRYSQMLETQIRQANKMDAIGRLASGIAHDFNNLLTIILGCAEVVGEDPAVANRHGENLGMMVKAGRRAKGLTKQLLAFSRQQVVAAEPLDVNALITEMTGMLSRLIGGHIEVALALTPDLSLAFADSSQLEQVVMNLVVNAKDAMPHGGTVTIQTTDVQLGHGSFPDEAVVPGSYVMLTVTDTGAGMSAEIQRHIFEPFFTTKEVGKGTGIGLSTTFGIVKQSKGHIRVISKPGHGTTFNVYLPRAKGVVPVEVFRALVAAPVTPASETVLVVEDEFFVRQLAKHFLGTAGYHVLEAANGDDAEEIFVRHADSINLLVTDLTMPGCGGNELLKRLRAHTPALKVLFMSGYSERAAVIEAGLTRGVPFVQKPFTAEEFARQVRVALGG